MKTATAALAAAAHAGAGCRGWLLVGAANSGRGAERVAPAGAAATPAATSGDAAAPARKIRYYRNPMGLPDTSPTPKKDPMGMDYIPVYEGEDDGGRRRQVGEDQRRPGAEARRAHRTRRAARRSSATCAPLGRVEIDERRVFAVAPKFEGWVEQLHVNATGQPVAKGQPLFEVYSPGTRVGAARIR